MAHLYVVRGGYSDSSCRTLTLGFRPLQRSLLILSGPDVRPFLMLHSDGNDFFPHCLSVFSGYYNRCPGGCADKGGFCLGAGNTVASYIPVENYLVMLDEGRKCG